MFAEPNTTHFLPRLRISAALCAAANRRSEPLVLAAFLAADERSEAFCRETDRFA